MEQNNNIKYKIILILFIISLMGSMILSFTPVSNTCSIVGGCEKVHNCCYNYTFGIQNSHYGVGIFLFLSILTFFQIKKPTEKKKKIIHLGVILGSLVALWFLYLQQFVIEAYCQYCLVVDFSSLAALAVIILKWRY